MGMSDPLIRTRIKVIMACDPQLAKAEIAEQIYQELRANNPHVDYDKLVRSVFNEYDLIVACEIVKDTVPYRYCITTVARYPNLMYYPVEVMAGFILNEWRNSNGQGR